MKMLAKTLSMKKINHLLSLFLFISASSIAQTHPFHDIHTHVGMRRSHDLNLLGVEVSEVISRAGYQGGFVLTSTYGTQDNLEILPNGQKYSHEYRMTTFATIDQALARHNKIVSEHAEKSFMLCGIYLYDTTSVNSLSPCLDLPTAVGAKIRGGSLKGDDLEQTSDDRVYYESLAKLLSILNARKGILLAHFEDNHWARNGDYSDCDDKNDDCLYGNANDTQRFIDLVKNYPNVTIVLAHSAVASFIGLDGLAQIKNSVIAPQVYVDTSQALGMSVSVSWYPKKKINHTRVNKIITAWKDYGIDHILYGSDFSPQHSRSKKMTTEEKDILLQKKLIEETTILSEEDKSKIFLTNYKNLIQKLKK